MASRGECVGEPSTGTGGEERIYVAVGKDVEENKLNLLWVLQNFRRKRIYILHVHLLPLINGNFAASRLNDRELRVFEDLERNIMHETRDKYLRICGQEGAWAVELHIEGEDIGKGIVELIRRHSIKKLVMGAAANKHHTEGMTDLKSIKATYVWQHAPPTCHIWFVCKGHLICTEEGGVDVEGIVSSLQTSSITETEPSSVQSQITSLQQRVTELETLYTEELKRRKEVEETLAKENEESEMIKNQLYNVLDHKLLLESRVASSDDMMRKLERERDNALKLTDDVLKTQTEQASSSHTPKFFSEFTYSEIREGTDDFSPSLKIGQGGYGSIYKGFLRHTQVAIKVPDHDSMQGPSEFQQEVDILSKLRHPNLVTLIGVCSEACILIYEYLPNGSLDDRLSCKDDTPPLPWQTRIRIAAELCSALIFLHSSKPLSIIHGDFKPANVLLDANFGTKLGDFGVSRALSLRMNIGNTRTLYHRTGPRGSYPYMDPQLARSGELSPQSDTYAFGVTQLQLLTGREALGIIKKVEDALRDENLSALLDPKAGDWPYVQAVEWARLALRCCEVQRRNRPDLGSVVLMTLERLKRASSPICLGPEWHSQPLSHFICPIRLEVMEDPHFAADGFTYEAEALREWLGSGRSLITSPMTNLPLENLNLVPNRALRSAIQEWQQNH